MVSNLTWTLIAIFFFAVKARCVIECYSACVHVLLLLGANCWWWCVVEEALDIHANRSICRWSDWYECLVVQLLWFGQELLRYVLAVRFAQFLNVNVAFFCVNFRSSSYSCICHFNFGIIFGAVPQFLHQDIQAEGIRQNSNKETRVKT